MELIRPVKQTVWRWPAVINFSLGGMGTGLYLVGALISVLPGSTIPETLLWTAVFKLLGPVLVSLGFLALTTEAGRPLRGINLFRHLRRSWMSRETLAGAVFIPAAIADWLLPHPILRALAVAGAIALMISQGFIVYRSKGVTAWSVPYMPVFFVTSAFAMGYGLVWLTTLGGVTIGSGVALIGLASILLNLVVWLLYLRQPDEEFQRAVKGLCQPDTLFLIVGGGHLLPALLIALQLAFGPGSVAQAVVASVAGLAMVAAGVSQKAGIILEAGYLRAIRLGPARTGSSHQRRVAAST